MPDQQLIEIVKTSPIVVQSGRYAYLQAHDASHLESHFLLAQDNEEMTIVTEEKNVDKVRYYKIVKWFKLLEVKVSAPFVAKGFLAYITKTIADKDLNVLVVSTFSKDYILVKEKIFDKAVEALKQAGFPVEFKE